MQRRIIEAGIKVMCQKGYAGTTTTLIAKEARVSQGILFHHFQTKQGLLLAMVRHGIEECTQAIREGIGEEKDPLKQIEKVAFAYSEMAWKMGALLEVVFREVKVAGVTTQQMQNTGLLRLRELLKEIVERGIRQGIIREIDPYVVVSSLLGTLTHNFLRWLMDNKSFSLQKSTEISVGIITRGISTM